MRNPFVYGESVTGENFCDRNTEIRKLKIDILNYQKIFLISSRRIGKTSLIKTVINQIGSKNVIPIFLDLEEFSSYKEFLNAYLSLLVQKSTSKNKILRFIKQVVSGLRIDFKIDETGHPLLSLGYAEPISTEVESRIFNLPETIATKQNKKLVIVFDEFQEILNLKRENIEGALRSHIQHQHNVAYIFAGSKKHLLNEMINSSDKPFYRIGPAMYLKKIPETQLLEFIKKKFAATEVDAKNEMFNKIINISDNIPYYVQMLSHELWDFGRNKRQLKEKDIQIVFSELLHQYSQNFHLEWSRLILSKRQLLKAIALYGGKQVLSKKYLKKSNLGLPSSVRRTLLSLVNNSYIDREDDEYFFTDILFREWIKSGVK